MEDKRSVAVVNQSPVIVGTGIGHIAAIKMVGGQRRGDRLKRDPLTPVRPRTGPEPTLRDNDTSKLLTEIPTLFCAIKSLKKYVGSLRTTPPRQTRPFTTGCQPFIDISWLAVIA